MRRRKTRRIYKLGHRRKRRRKKKQYRWKEGRKIVVKS